MLRNIIRAYKKFVDEKIGNGTLVVSIIAILIVAIWSCTPNANYLKSSAMDAQSYVQTDDIITIWWKNYQLVLQD